MRNFVEEMLLAWTGESKQAAYNTGVHLLREIRKEFEHLKRQETAIQALGSYLREDPEIDQTAPSPEPEPAIPETQANEIEPAQRPRVILRAADEVWEAQQNPWGGSETNLINTRDVHLSLKNKGLDLGVSQPLAVIGTVLASAEGYTKIARNTFEYSPPQEQEEGVEDLPW